MVKFISLLFLIIFSSLFSQKKALTTQEAIDKEIELAEKTFYSNTNEALVIFLRTYSSSQNIKYKQGIIKSCKYLMFLYHERGEERKSIEYSNVLEKIAKELNDNESLSKVYNQRAMAYSALSLFDESYEEFQKALKFIKKTTDKNRYHYDMSSIYQAMVGSYYEPTHAHQDTILTYLKKSLREAELMDDKDGKIHPDNKYDMISYLNMNIGMFYTGVHKPQRLDLAEEYLQKSLKTINDRKFTKIKINKIPILNALGRFYIEDHQYETALGYANESLQLEKRQKSPNDRVLAYSILVNSYEELNKKDSIIKYMKLYTNLNDSIVHVNKMMTNVTVKKINAKKESAYKDIIFQIILFSMVFIILICVVWWYFWKKNRKKSQFKYTTITEKLKETYQEDNNIPSVDNTDIERSLGINIKDDTTHAILLKLNKLEKSQKFIKKDISLTSLANELNTNPRYLSEIIKQYKGKNYNNYINGLRINYIINMLYENPTYREYKISYLAEASGFSSREVFAVIFKKETGVTPSYFINSLKKEEDTE